MRLIKKAISLAAILSCSAIIVSCTTMRKNHEEDVYYQTRKQLRDVLPYSVIKDCGYRFDLHKPLTVSHRRFEGDMGGYYQTKYIEVHYEKGNWGALHHEYQHFLNHNAIGGKVGWYCLDQVTAYQAEEIRRLKKQNKMLKTRLNSGR